MINVQDFLIRHGMSAYALVTYEGDTEATLFSQHYFEDENRFWYLESPCQLQNCGKLLEKDIPKYVEEMYELKSESQIKYFEKYTKSMIRDGVLYEIMNWQVAPYLPKEVDDIKIITEQECLDWLLEREK